MAYGLDFCWECDAPVRVGATGWYSCPSCGYESLRPAQMSSPATPPDVRHDFAEARRAKRGAGLVSLSHKGNIS